MKKYGYRRLTIMKIILELLNVENVVMINILCLHYLKKIMGEIYNEYISDDLKNDPQIQIRIQTILPDGCSN